MHDTGPDAVHRVPPLPAGYVRLDALARLLDDHGDRRLVVVAAPAGYGKTSVLAAYVHGLRDRHVSWLTADPGIDDPGRFVAALAAGVRRMPDLSGEADDLLRQDAPPLDVVHTLVNEAARTRRGIVSVIDGFEQLRSAEVHDLVRILIDGAPPNWRFLIASRTAPPLRLAHWRTQLAAAEITAADLRFGPDETASVLRAVCGLAVHSETAAALSDRTHGWVQGILLAGRQAMTASNPDASLRSFSGADASVADYIVREVVDGLEPRVSRFVLDTAVLHRLTGALCAAVTGDPATATVLHELAATQTFLFPVDGTVGWFEYHPTFQEAFRAVAAREAGAETSAYQRARAWCLAQGLLCDAVDYAIRAAGRDGTDAADQLRAHGDALIDECPPERVVDAIDRLPSRFVLQRPALRMLAARSALASGDVDAAVTHVGALRDGASSAPAWDDELHPGLLSVGIDLCLHQWRLDEAVTLARQTAPWWGTRSPRNHASQAGVARLAVSVARTLWLAGESRRAADVLAELTGEISLARRIERDGLRSLIAYRHRDERSARSDAIAVSRLVSRAPLVTTARCAPYGALAALWGGVDRDLRWMHDCLSPTAGNVPGDLDCVRSLIAAELAWRSGRIGASRAALDRASSVARRFDQATALEALIGIQAERCATQPAGPVTLSPSERAVLAHLPLQLTTRQVAERLYLSHNTVKTHLRTLYRKLGVSSRSAAVRRADDLALLAGRGSRTGPQRNPPAADREPPPAWPLDPSDS